MEGDFAGLGPEFAEACVPPQVRALRTLLDYVRETVAGGGDQIVLWGKSHTVSWDESQHLLALGSGAYVLDESPAGIADLAADGWLGERFTKWGKNLQRKLEESRKREEARKKLEEAKAKFSKTWEDPDLPGLVEAAWRLRLKENHHLKVAGWVRLLLRWERQGVAIPRAFDKARMMDRKAPPLAPPQWEAVLKVIDAYKASITNKKEAVPPPQTQP